MRGKATKVGMVELAAFQSSDRDFRRFGTQPVEIAGTGGKETTEDHNERGWDSLTLSETTKRIMHSLVRLAEGGDNSQRWRWQRSQAAVAAAGQQKRWTTSGVLTGQGRREIIEQPRQRLGSRLRSQHLKPDYAAKLLATLNQGTAASGDGCFCISPRHLTGRERWYYVAVRFSGILARACLLGWWPFGPFAIP
jgi:hypothetical protein